jgi:histidyl-tRNA synthetase
MPQIQPPRGTYDILPPDTDGWQRLEQILRSTIQNYGYKEIRVPIFEHTELFHRGVGETTDIVNKEMYTFEDKSNRSLTLRPECTAGVVRSYLTNGLSRQPAPVKLWYMGPMFRYERTQTGRQRQFHQTGVEVFGSAGPAIDAEVLLIGVDLLQRVGIDNFKVNVNSIGCKNCRPAYREILKEALRAKLDQLCEDCHDRFERNPLRMLDCKNEKCQGQYNDLPAAINHLCAECEEHWQGFLALCGQLDVPLVVNERLVRGLDYYSRTVFEIIVDDPRLGAQSTILGGGRYDYLVEMLGGSPTAGVGWALGMERWRLLLSDSQPAAPFVFVVAHTTEGALQLATAIRREGFSCEMDFPATGQKSRAFGKQLERANKLGVSWTVIQGEDELSSGTVTVKDMRGGEQSKVPQDRLLHFLRERQDESTAYGQGPA